MPVPTRQPFSTKEKRAAVELVRAQLWKAVVPLKNSREQLKMNKRTLRLSHTTANPDVFLNGWGTLFMDRTLFIAHTVTVRCASKLITFRSADFASPGGKLSLTCGQTFPPLWANFPSPVDKLSLPCGQTFPPLWANFSLAWQQKMFLTWQHFCYLTYCNNHRIINDRMEKSIKERGIRYNLR